MPHYDAHIYQLCSINPKISYLLVTSSLNNKQLQSIHNIIYPSVIASKGFNRNWPESLRYGSHKFCGLEIMDYWVEQRLKKIQMIHKLLLHPEYQILIQEIIEWYQISAGVSSQILANPSKVKYINRIWIQDLLDFMTEFQIKLFTTTFFAVNYQCQNDKCIMKEVGKLQLPKQKNIQLNAYTMYLQVATLRSDIVNLKKKKL